MLVSTFNNPTSYSNVTNIVNIFMLLGHKHAGYISLALDSQTLNHK